MNPVRGSKRWYKKLQCSNYRLRSAGLFAAIWLEKLGMDKIAIIDRNSYPAGGLLNDGKLNFDYRIGLDINELQIDREITEKIMQEIKKIFIGISALPSGNLH